MVLNYANTIKGTLTPINDGVIVTDMFFGEQKTKVGLIQRDQSLQIQLSSESNRVQFHQSYLPKALALLSFLYALY